MLLKRILLLAAVALWVTSCRPDEDFGGNATSVDALNSVKPAQLAGTWRAASVTVVDNDAVDRGFPTTSSVTGAAIQRLDISSQFNLTQYRLTFNVDGSGNPTTFTVTANGAPNFIGYTTGNWSVDHPIYTSRITTRPAMGTTGAVRNFGIRRAITQGTTRIFIRFERYNALNRVVLSYEYEFVKV